MPSVSGKQHRLMAAVATNPAVAKKTKIPQSVGKEFMEADKGKKFKGGGEMKESKAMVKKEIGFMKKKGAPKSMIKHEMAEAGMKKSGTKKMAMGGMGQRPPTMPGKPMPPNPVSRPPTTPGKPMPPNPVSRPPTTPGKPIRPGIGMKNGGMAASKMGSVKTAAPSRDGIAVQGKTKGKQVVMAGNRGMKKGGYC
jgi:hypothetical protein